MSETETKQPSRTQRAIDYIAKKGSARSDEIAAAIDIEPKDVSALLAPAAAGGFLVTCKVSRPGKPPVNEYRLSAGYAPSEWRNFRIKRGTAPTSVKVPPVVAKESATPKARLTSSATQIAGESLRKAATPSVPVMAAPMFHVDSNGQLTINLPAGPITLTPAETRLLGNFMDITEPAWS